MEDYTGYIVATDDRMITVFTNLEEAEDYVKYKKEYLKSTEGWHVVICENYFEL